MVSFHLAEFARRQLLQTMDCKESGIRYSQGMDLVLEIPDLIAETLPASPAERQREMRFALACGLFAMGAADSGPAAELAGMGRLGFLEAYGKHGLRRPYHDEDLTDDIAFARHR